MIFAKNADALDYRGIHPNLDMALERITPEFLSALGAEKVDVKAGEVWCTKFTYETIPDEESFFEAHEKFLDIHLMLEGSERWSALIAWRATTFTPTGARPGTSWFCPRGISWWCSPATPIRSRCRWTAPAQSQRLSLRSRSAKT